MGKIRHVTTTPFKEKGKEYVRTKIVDLTKDQEDKRSDPKGT